MNFDIKINTQKVINLDLSQIIVTICSAVLKNTAISLRVFPKFWHLLTYGFTHPGNWFIESGEENLQYTWNII
jgi:hypothetical protein